MELAVGTAIGVAGLIAGFQGAVEGYRLLTDIFASETGLDSAATQYNVQSIRFSMWAEQMKIDDPDGCILHQQAPVLINEFARLIAEIYTIQETVGQRFIEKYAIDNHDTKPDLISGNAAAYKTLGSFRSLTERLRGARSRTKNKHRWMWAFKDHEDFGEFISQLTRLNDALESLVRPLVRELDRHRTIKEIWTGLDERLSLATIHKPDARPDSILALGSLIKTIQIGQTAHKVRQITASELDLELDPELPAAEELAARVALEVLQFKVLRQKSGRTLTERTMGYYSSNESGASHMVMVEWKQVRVNDPFAREIESRVHKLGELLSTPLHKDFHRLPFLGLFQDKDFEQQTCGQQRRIGIVYEIVNIRPGGLGQPTTLRDLLLRTKNTKGSFRPPLGDRFRLAYRLASALSLFHATDWLHRSFHSDNIIINEESLDTPCLTGFQYSRPALEQSLESSIFGEPELDMYCHPEIDGGWTKVKEIYSLGIVLIEVAAWRPLYSKGYATMSSREVAKDIRDALEGKYGRDLEGMVGKVYMDVVRWCLDGPVGFRKNDGDDASRARALSKVFSFHVIQPLATCNA